MSTTHHTAIDTPRGPLTFAEALAPAAVDFATLHRRYGPLLDLVRRLIGVIPNCDPYLEIWPTAFRSYNLMVPNLLNLPFVLFGAGVEKSTLGLAMYASSRAARCAYCSAHACAFALRRGADAAQLAGLTERTATLGEAERAAIEVAEALSVVPSATTAEQRDALRRAFTPADAEWIVLGVAMMGFLNKMMDGLGVELEQAAVDEVEPVIGKSGWSAGKHRVMPTRREAMLAASHDGWRSVAALLPQLPRAILWERRYTKGVPSSAAEVAAWLEREIGHDVPVLARLRHRRAARAIALMVRDNLAPATSSLGVEVKHAVALVFARTVGARALDAMARALLRSSPAPIEAAERAVDGVFTLETEEEIARQVRELGRPAGSERAALALLVAREASPSPTALSPALVARATRELGAEGVVELMSWLSVLQLLHRLDAFYAS